MTQAPVALPRERSYLRLLVVLLGTTTFFEGYDAAIAAVVLPELARSFGVDAGSIGNAVALVGFGAYGALFVTALGDNIGRKPLLIGTTLAYALFTGLTATADSVAAFSTFQFLARIFLISEFATAITMAAEEFPPERRGRALGLLTALGGVGLVAVAALYQLLAQTSIGWRGLYLIGVIPLLIVAPLRTRLRETRHWLDARASGRRIQRVPYRALFRSRYRGRLLKMGAVYFFSHIAILAGLTWWTWFARNERGFSLALRNRYLISTALLGLVGYFVAGRLQDRIGRRPTGVAFFLAGMLSAIVLFQTHGRGLAFAAMVAGVFFGLGANPVISAVASELFPTEIRATSVAIVRAIFGTSGAILGPFLVGRLAGPLGSVGNAVTLVALSFLPAALFLWRLPETAGAELGRIGDAPAQAGEHTPVAAAAGSQVPLTGALPVEVWREGPSAPEP